MTTAAGIGLLAGGTAVGVVAMVLWHRSAAPIGLLLAAATGAAVGSGGMLLAGRGGAGDWVLAVGLLAVFGPAHLWVLLGRPGPNRGGLLPTRSGPRTKAGIP
ncbi:MAG: hypothetical protein ACE14W_02195 [Candidatus Velamenicoccus archaeovorus]